MIQKFKIKMLCFDEGYEPYWDEMADMKMYGGKKRAMNAAREMAAYEADGWVRILKKGSIFSIVEIQDGYAVLKQDAFDSQNCFQTVTEYHCVAA